MIKANELRIGNLFIRELCNSRRLEYDDSFILTEEWMGKLFSDNISIALQDLHPIPLTPEILEKCGFVLDEDAGYYFLDLPGKPQNIDRLKVGKGVFVHQLQNLYFALTGEELKVTL